MAKSSATSGGATFLDEPPADVYRPPVGRETDARPSRPARTGSGAEDDADEPFLRARRRVPVRRGLLPSWTRSRWGKLLLGVGILGALGAALAMILIGRSFLDHDPRFRIDSSASIQTMGNSQLNRADLLSVFGSDIGRNVFFVPLEKRREELEQIPWVQRATVMRLLPNQLRVAITERKPIAFVEMRGHVELADADGVLLTMTPMQMAERRYSFPVVVGINAADPLSVRAARMEAYQRFLGGLDATGEHVSAQISEVDLSDPDDVRATVPVGGSDLLLHFGDDDFLARWHNYQAHIAQWQQQYPHLASIDLRYDREVVLKMAGDPGASAAASPASAPKAAAPKTEAPRPAAPRAESPKPVAKPVAKSVPGPSPVAARPSRGAVADRSAKLHKPTTPKHAPAAKPHSSPEKPHAGATHSNRGTA